MAELTEVDVDDLMTAFVKPKIKVLSCCDRFDMILCGRLALSG